MIASSRGSAHRLWHAQVDVELRFWFGAFGPKGLPDAVKVELEKALFKGRRAPELAGQFRKIDLLAT
jgi:hypothetical protein